ncbi:hypothetical protein HYS48_04430 [Candidatus Woesearchaeota archaeon]|nr:hypothetical protein [Candidatus Woesearchaeota archaeon]
MLQNKRGIELSLHLLVIFIISIILFAFGMVFARNFLKSSEELIEMTQEDIDKRMQALSCSGAEIVCLDLGSKELERGEQHIFGLNIVNALKDLHTFQIQAIPNSEHLQIVFENAPMVLEPNEERSTGILIGAKKNAVKGNYVVEMQVLYDRDKDGIADDAYDRPHRIHIVVQ